MMWHFVYTYLSCAIGILKEGLPNQNAKILIHIYEHKPWTILKGEHKEIDHLNH